jgi:hypothetical protein
VFLLQYPSEVNFMTELTTNLIIRVKLYSTPAISAADVDGYRCDRILAMFAGLALAAMLTYKLLVAGPAEPIVVAVATVTHPEDAASAGTGDITRPVWQQTADHSVSHAAGHGSSGVLDEPVRERLANEADDGDVLPPPEIVPALFLTPLKTRIISPRVTRFVISKEVRDKEPLGEITDIAPGQNSAAPVKVYAFSQVQHLLGETLYYRWMYHDRTVANVRVEVGSASWRSHSSKYLSHTMRGHWRVELQTERSELLAFSEFVY